MFCAYNDGAPSIADARLVEPGHAERSRRAISPILVRGPPRRSVNIIGPVRVSSSIEKKNHPHIDYYIRVVGSYMGFEV
jgi:hypothetical protein